jgi:bifunctional non-homologous end joining protein LigD
VTLRRYQQMRDFDRTPEPRGEAPAGEGAGRFVIQKHAATRLHYDFRLELDGVLKSWAVPKGPSLNPRDRRLAVHVEDHPVEYGSFEGIIPKGEYGGGTVVLWDRGRWYPEGDAHRGLKKGHLRFRLAGEKLHGGFSLVRMHDGDNWLLIKSEDDEASGDGEALVRERPESVASGRTLADIAGEPDRVWRSKRKGGSSWARGVLRRRAAKSAEPPRYGHSPQPEQVSPELATLVDEVPPGEGWLHEIKYDGYRLIARIDRGTVELRTRKHEDWSARLPWLVDALRAQVPVEAALIDGELVHLGADGVTRFGALQKALAEGHHGSLVYYAFDLLHLQGVDLRDVPLVQRKEGLAQLLAELPAKGRIRLSEHIVGDGGRLISRACKLGLEGVISKRADSPYRAGRHRDWLKIKCSRRQEVVIGGFTEARSGPRRLGALLVGVYDEEGNFVYSGRVGTGFDHDAAADMRARLDELAVARSQFLKTPPGFSRSKFVRPELVGEVEFSEWTTDGRMRHPVFVGLREDRQARDVRRERPEAVDEAVKPGKQATASKEVAVREQVTASEEATSKKATARRAGSKQTASKRTASKKAGSEQTANKRAGSEQTASKKATARRAGSKQAAARRAGSKKAASKKASKTAAASKKTSKTAANGKTAVNGATASERLPRGAVEVLGVTLTHPDRVVYPDDGITKRDIAEYYESVAGWILPWVESRGLSVVRCPDGVSTDPRKCFFQKHIHHALPPSLHTAPLDADHEPFLYIEDAPGLVALTQVGVLELHVWGSTIERPDDPDRMIFDLDPGPNVPWERVKETAAALRTRLEDLDLASFLKTTGGKGLHIVVPLTRGRQTWDTVKSFSQGIAREFAEAAPKLFTATASKAGRTGRIYIDYLRNSRGATAVAPYSTRARPGAPVAVPLRWDELAGLETPQRYTVRTLARRLAALKADPWRELTRVRQSLRLTTLREVLGRAA